MEQLIVKSKLKLKYVTDPLSGTTKPMIYTLYNEFKFAVTEMKKCRDITLFKFDDPNERFGFSDSNHSIMTAPTREAIREKLLENYVEKLREEKSKKKSRK